MCCLYINAGKPWIYGIPSDKQERYQPVTKCTYWPVFGAFNNWNIIELSSKSTSTETFDEIHQVNAGQTLDIRYTIRET